MLKIGKLNVMFEHHYNKNQQKVVKTIIFNEKKVFLGQGKATCSKKDNFCKNKGRVKALKDAFDKIKTLTKEERTKFWKSYQTEMTTNPRW